MPDKNIGTTPSENSLLLLAGAIARIDWAAEHFHRFQSYPQWEELEKHAASAKVPNERGENTYAFFVTRGIKTGVQTASVALRTWHGPDGIIPSEVLLRTALIGASKALYLLAPDELESREGRAELVYKSDRNAKKYALENDRRLRGEKVDSGPREKPGVSDSKIIRDALDDFVAKGNCKCGKPECPQEDLESLRHRILQIWWIYSSVSHSNQWHLETVGPLARYGEEYSNGDFGPMAWDVAYVVCKAVETLYRRYNLDERIDPLVLDWERMRKKILGS